MVSAHTWLCCNIPSCITSCCAHLYTSKYPTLFSLALIHPWVLQPGLTPGPFTLGAAAQEWNQAPHLGLLSPSGLACNEYCSCLVWRAPGPSSHQCMQQPSQSEVYLLPCVSWQVLCFNLAWPAPLPGSGSCQHAQPTGTKSGLHVLACTAWPKACLCSPAGIAA